MYNQLYNYFVSRRLLSDSLSGFLKGHSCCTSLLKITEDWREALDERQTVSAVSIDLSKAFDTICHCLLIIKLAAYGLLDHSIQLIRSYLINRKQRVKIENAYSNWCVVQCGVYVITLDQHVIHRQTRVINVNSQLSRSLEPTAYHPQEDRKWIHSPS